MTNWNKIAEIFDEILKTSSTNAKKDILRKHKDFEDFKIILHLTYNPYIRFHITRVVPDASTLFRVPQDHDYTMEHFLDDLEKVSERQITGDNAIEWISQIYRTLPYSFQPYLEKILKKDLKIGCATGLINDVFPGWIPEFKLPLCERWNKVYKKLSFPYICEPKIDGVRSLLHLDKDGNTSIYARSGIKFEGFKHIEDEIQQYQEFNGYVFDGEIKDETFQKTMNSARSLKGDEFGNAKFYIWDIISENEFFNQEKTSSLESRKIFLTNLEKKNLKSIEVIPYTFVESLEEIKTQFEYWYNLGQEGIILKDPNSSYFYKRHKNWIKYKIQNHKEGSHEISAKILEVYPGDPTTKYAKTLGGFKCEFDYQYDKGKTDDSHQYTKVQFSVGSGFLDNQRDEFWKRRNELIGQIVDIEYQEITLNKDGQFSVRFPIFKRFRPDLI